MSRGSGERAVQVAEQAGQGRDHVDRAVVVEIAEGQPANSAPVPWSDSTYGWKAAPLRSGHVFVSTETLFEP